VRKGEHVPLSHLAFKGILINISAVAGYGFCFAHHRKRCVVQDNSSFGINLAYI